MQDIVAISAATIALAYVVWRLARTFRGKHCNCAGAATAMDGDDKRPSARLRRLPIVSLNVPKREPSVDEPDA